MRKIKYSLLLLLALVVAESCNKSKEPSIVLDKNALYFAEWGASPQTISFVPTNTVRVAQVSISDGFECSIDNQRHIITVAAKGADDGKNDALATNGMLHVNALSKEGDTTGYTIYLYICGTVELDSDAKYANSYIVSQSNVRYTFDAKHKPDGTALNTASAKLLWQSETGVVKNVNYSKQGTVSFIIEPLSGESNEVYESNAVIAAYDKSGQIIWSWHIWIVNDDPTLAKNLHIYSNGQTFMDRNLGAFSNSDGSHDTKKIHDSYGLYYQWGRKDPFLRPYDYLCSNGDGERIYSASDIYYSSEVMVETSSKTGTIAYATAHPMEFITNAQCVEESGDGIGDWLQTTDNTMWDNQNKSLYDPCPYGWKVPSAEDISVLSLYGEEDETDLETARKQYGWRLSDIVGAGFFYNACGYRRYNDGKIQNMNHKEGVYPSTPEPWEGHYWTSTANSDGSAVSLYFDLTTTRAINKFDNNHPSRRANGMQVRCVKIK